ncbi:MAG TPA: AlkA N-terminal domain-containing protein, partial [Acidimicrobiales bacterium]|nr:AlkA N-terminal domain-containing protein [Acidimicrobiales bacterium]
VMTLAPADGHVRAEFTLADLRDLSTAIARARHLCNLDADPEAVDRALGADPALASSVARRAGLRVPGTVDGFETAVRAVAGQQVSVAGARTVLGGVVAAADVRLTHPDRSLTHVFPDAAETALLVERHPEAFAMPAARRAAVAGLAAAVADGRLAIDPGASPVELRAALVTLPGIGPWTAEYVAMRGLGDPDSFLPSDLGTRRGAAARGVPDDPRSLAAHAERWRPWRSYAQMHLWTTAVPGDASHAPTGDDRDLSRHDRKAAVA